MDFYSIFKLLHVLCAIAWVGGGLTLLVASMLASRAAQPTTLFGILDMMNQLGKTWFIPASLLTVIFGAVATTFGGLWGDMWVILGLLGFLNTFLSTFYSILNSLYDTFCSIFNSLYNTFCNFINTSCSFINTSCSIFDTFCSIFDTFCSISHTFLCFFKRICSHDKYNTINYLTLQRHLDPK